MQLFVFARKKMAMLGVLFLWQGPQIPGLHVGDCMPPEGFDGCVAVSVTIRATPEECFRLVTDIENLSDFWPGYEFRREGQGPLRPGARYYSRRKGQKKWTPYRIVELMPGRRMVGELDSSDGPFARLRYDHRFEMHDGQTRSKEQVSYKLRYGLLGKVLDRLVVRKILKKQLVRAHLRLKQRAESGHQARGE